MKEKWIFRYIINVVVSSYLETRGIMFTQKEYMQVSQGVPQSSVVVPVLWNILYDGILNIDSGERTRTVAYVNGNKPAC